MAGYLFFDIETVCDWKLFEKAASEREKEKREKAQEEGTDYFPKAIYHVPIAVCVLLLIQKGILKIPSGVLRLSLAKTPSPLLILSLQPCGEP